MDLTANYSAQDFENDVSTMKPRFVDIYMIPPLCMYAAWKTRDVNKWVRRSLFVAGIYMIYRNLKSYTEFPQTVQKYANLIQGKTDESL